MNSSLIRRLLVCALLAAVPAWAAADVYQDAMMNKDRSAKDRERDARELPADLAHFAQEKAVGLVETVDLVDGGHFLSALHGELKCLASDPA